MILFKSTDEKLRDIGFEKVDESEHGVFYERLAPQNFVQEVAILHRYNGRHIIRSYDQDTDTVCGLTYHEARLFLRKMRELGWHKEEQE